MTDRVKGFTVTLAEDMRIDDIEPIMQAIRMIKGVIDVQPSITDSNDHINRIQVLSNIRKKFIKFLEEEL
ncbi:MAG: hypothetical protein WC428_02630 [Candidatus Paceibacterota bacterium]